MLIVFLLKTNKLDFMKFKTSFFFFFFFVFFSFFIASSLALVDSHARSRIGA